VARRASGGLTITGNGTVQEPEFDFIVVGAGSAGCVVANRLSADRSQRVLLIEAGGRDSNIKFRIPLMVVHLLRDPRFTWPFETVPQASLNDRTQLWVRGKVLGGSSSINGNVYVRGDPAVFDSWEDMGAPGWSYAEMLPYFKRMEDFPQGDPERRGHGGPIGVTKLDRFDRLADAFLAGCGEIGHEVVEDYNGGSYEGASYLEYSTRRGFRCSTASAYLRPARSHKNLEVWTDCTVTRVVLDGRRVVGIECRRGGETVVAGASKEVLLSAGPVQSPKILELSGIGQPEILRDHGIAVLHPLAGVGENLSDHPNTRATFECSQPITINDVLQRPLVKVKEGLRFILFGKGLLSICSATAHDITRSSPDGEHLDLKIQLQPFSGKDRYARRPEDGLDPYSGFTVGVMALRPQSRGWVHVQSNDPLAHPRIEPRYLSAEADARTLIAGIRAVRRVAGTPAMKPFVTRETRPGPDVQSDEELLEYVRATTQTTWHVVGSCKMGTDGTAVVDPELRVQGLSGLRVIDSSVFPTIPSSNTNAPTIALAERGADLVLNAWSNKDIRPAPVAASGRGSSSRAEAR